VRHRPRRRRGWLVVLVGWPLAVGRWLVVGWFVDWLVAWWYWLVGGLPGWLVDWVKYYANSKVYKIQN
jgi:hypothetical protein